MNRYIKLVHYEWMRLRYLYLSLLLMTLLSQFGGLVWFAWRYMNRVHEYMDRENMTAADYVRQYSTISFYEYTASSVWFMAPIALCVAVLLIYVLFIWYRDWFGKNMFIYRLLMIPVARMNLFFSKLSVILLSVFGLVAFQLLILPLENAVFQALVSDEFIQAIPTNDIIRHHPLLQVVIPLHMSEFAVYYGIGTMAVIVIFTAILLERSYRMKGLVAGLVYAIAAGLLFLFPILLWENGRQTHYLYPTEFLWLELIMGIVITGISLWISMYLIRNKVTV